jgi:ribose transport system substrate-binding protein
MTAPSAKSYALSWIITFAVMLGAGQAMADDASGLAAAKELVNQHGQPGKFVAPGPAFDAKRCMTGKKIMVIPLTKANPFSANVAQAMKNSADEVGFPLRVFDNQFDVRQWVQGIQIATSEKYDLIDLSTAPEPSMLEPQVKAARAAGVKVTVSHWYDTNQKIPDFIDGAALAPFSDSVRLLSAWAIAKTEGKADVVWVNSDEVISAAPAKETIVATFKQFCPTCKSKFLNVPLPDWSSRMTSNVQAALLADPGINYVLPFYDGMSQFVVPAIKLVNRPDVKIASFNGTPFVLDMVRDGIVEMDVGESVGWIGAAALDYDMRLLCGVQGEATLNVPLYIFDKDNVKSAGVPATYGAGYSDVYIAGFHKLWGLQ